MNYEQRFFVFQINMNYGQAGLSVPMKSFENKPVFEKNGYSTWDNAVRAIKAHQKTGQFVIIPGYSSEN